MFNNVVGMFFHNDIFIKVQSNNQKGVEQNKPMYEQSGKALIALSNVVTMEAVAIMYIVALPGILGGLVRSANQRANKC